MPKEKKDTDPKPTDTAADLKMKIEKKQADMAQSKGKALDDGKTPQPDVLDASTGSEPRPNSASGSQAGTQPTAGDKPGNDVNPLAWAKEKGLETPEAIARSLREMEAEFHRRNQNNGNGWIQPSAPQMPPPAMQPQPSYGPSNVPPQPPPYYPPPTENKEFMDTIGRHYDINPQDVPKLVRFTNDFFEAKRQNWEQQLNQQYSTKIAAIERENVRNSEFRELMQDPVFKDPQVAQEMHRIFEKDPNAFGRESSPHRWAYKEALVNIARRNLQGNETMPTASTGYSGLPSRPPSETRPGSLQKEGEPDSSHLNVHEFAALPLEEKTKLLTRLGVRPPPI